MHVWQFHADDGTERKRWNRYGHWRACCIRRVVRLWTQRGRVSVVKAPVELPWLRFYSLATPRLFEGMPDSFFEAYHDHMPKTEPVEQYELRRDLYELFHYLNHTVLFGVSVWLLVKIR
jgi:hypothetical protein